MVPDIDLGLKARSLRRAASLVAAAAVLGGSLAMWASRSDAADGCVGAYGPEPCANLSVAASVSTASVQDGATVTVTFTVSNPGPATADNTTLRIGNPASPTSLSSTAGSCQPGADSSTCSLGPVPVGARVGVTAAYVVRRGQSTGSSVGYTGVVDSDVLDDHQGDNTASAEVTILRQCSLLRRGSSRGDRLTGTSDSNRLLGLGGNDRLTGLDGDDCLFGGAANDRLDGGAGDDRLDGGAGSDLMYGGAGDDRLDAGVRGGTDRLYGGSGDDTLTGNPGGRTVVVAGPGNDMVGLGNVGALSSTVSAGPGNDRIDAHNEVLYNKRDTVDCGPGRDTVLRDPVDRVRNCEDVQTHTLRPFGG